MLHRLLVVLIPVVFFLLATPPARGQTDPLDVNGDGVVAPMDALSIINSPFQRVPPPVQPHDYAELVQRLSFLWDEYLAMNCPSPVITQLVQSILDLLDIADLFFLLGDAAGAEAALRAAEQLLLELESELTHLALTCEFAVVGEDAVAAGGAD